MLSYPISPKLFDKPEHFDRTRQAVQDNRITTSDIISIKENKQMQHNSVLKLQQALNHQKKREALRNCYIVGKLIIK